MKNSPMGEASRMLMICLLGAACFLIPHAYLAWDGQPTFLERANSLPATSVLLLIFATWVGLSGVRPWRSISCMVVGVLTGSLLFLVITTDPHMLWPALGALACVLALPAVLLGWLLGRGIQYLPR